MVKRWREQLATIQNEELARTGAAKRYDARSYKDQGIDRVGGQHRGTKRAALEASGRAADHWSQECPEWTQLLDDIGRELDTWEATDAERAGVHEAIEEARLRDGGTRAGRQARSCGDGVAKYRKRSAENRRAATDRTKGGAPKYASWCERSARRRANARCTYRPHNGRWHGERHDARRPIQSVWAQSQIESPSNTPEVRRRWRPIHARSHAPSPHAHAGFATNARHGGHATRKQSARARTRCDDSHGPR